jgi:alpha-L-rhamnosidase
MRKPSLFFTFNQSLLMAVLFISFLSSCLTSSELFQADKLVVSEGFKNPVGFYDALPTFSWQLPMSTKIVKQQAYQIVAASEESLLSSNPDLWDSQKIASDQTTWIKYEGKKLTSRQKVYWQMRYWDQDGKTSKWSDINSFELGLLNNTDWTGKWIGLPITKDSLKGPLGNLIHIPQYLRKDFEVTSDVSSAKLFITAKGIFDVWLNQNDVSTDVMPPGWTPYNRRIETLSYDVSKMIVKGKNTIGVELAAGWHLGRVGWQKSFWTESQSPKVLCQLELTMKDGSIKIITTDDTWKGTMNGPTRFAEIYDGEIYDANFELPDWTKSSYDDRTWSTVETENLSNEVKLEPKRHATVKEKFVVQAKEIVSKTNNSVIFDFGQNIVGVPLIKVPVRKGDTIRLRFAEMLSPDGSFYTENYRSAVSTDYYIATENRTIEWAPKFTFHGFRYLELSGYDESQNPALTWVSGQVQYSDFGEQGSFTSSHQKLNQLQSNIVWGLRGNFFDIPTDCPQRDERLGWTGDAQVFAPTSIYNADVYAFWASWLQSLRETQFDNGIIPFVVPDVLKNNAVSSGWGDAAVIIPWDIYYRTGDIGILEDNYDMMKKWVGYHESIAKAYISNMNSFSDWLQPYPTVANSHKGDTPMSLISTAYFGHVAHLLAKTAKVLNNTQDQAKYETLYQNVAKAFEKQFFDENGVIKNNKGTQTGYLLALGFDLLSDENRTKAAAQLLKKIEEADFHLRTGFLGTPLLSKVLDEMGRADLMYKLLLNETYPSWFYSINQGATTIWERWNSYSKTEGFNKEKMNSLNHYAYGAIGQWMYERIGGLSPLEAGYKKIRIAPVLNDAMNSASSTLNTPFGKASSSWVVKGKVFEITAIVPANTTALIEVPANISKALLYNGKEFREDHNVKLISKEENKYMLNLLPGTYVFSSFIE